VSSRTQAALRFAGLLACAPAAGLVLTEALGLELASAVPALAVLALVWALFLLQAFSGRDARTWLRYHRLRQYVLRGADGRPHGARRSIPGPGRSGSGLAVAWSHDGWAEADGNLVGLGRLAARFDVVAFGTEARHRGTSPVPLELLPARAYDEGMTLEGLTEQLAAFDVVWACGTFEGTTLQALDARATGGPAVVCYDWENIVANYGHVRHPIRERALREVDHFCAATATAKAVLELDGVDPSRISIVPPVVEIPDYSDAQRTALRTEGRRRWELDDDDLVILFLGRGVWEKGLHTIAAAASTLARNEHGPPIRWLIAGTGDYIPEVGRILDRYDAGGAVRMAGQLRGHDRHVAYAAADGLVLPSLPTPRWLEQFGRVIPEAFAFGLPVIGSDSGAIPEVVGDAGIVVPAGDHLALAAAALQLTYPARRADLAGRASQRLAERFSVDDYVARIGDALERAHARRTALSGG
jgi:glycosyltransferase involved in cell wall biosynthesis